MKRRTFIKYTVLGGINVCFFTSNKVFAEVSKSIGLSSSAEEGKSLSKTNLIENIALSAQPVEIIRPIDLLNLRFEFVNLKLVKGATLERMEPGKDAFIRVIFPPQHLSEQAFKELGSVPDPPISAWIAGQSRLVFRVPAGVDTIPYTLRGLLSWNWLEPSLVPAAKEASYRLVDATQLKFPPPSRVNIGGFASRNLFTRMASVKNNLKGLSAKIAVFDGLSDNIIEPGPDQTAIEAPRRLILSPHQFSAWAHYVDPFTNPEETETSEQSDSTVKKQFHPVYSGISQTGEFSAKKSPLLNISQVERTELWHTRLGLKNKLMPFGVGEETELCPNTVRAVYTPDLHADNVGSSGRFESLTSGERYEIVHLSSDNTIPERNSIHASNLMLSPLGAWLDLQGKWILSGGGEYSIESWTHRAVMGRDTFVRIVVKGYLFPFGHRASQVVVTERRFENGIAYLRFFTFIIVREPEKIYTKDGLGLDEKSIEGRRIPLGAVRIKTLVTPHLNPDLEETSGWIMADNKNFLFKMEAEDWEGNVCEFLAPLNFVKNTDAESSWTSEPSPVSVLGKNNFFKKKYIAKPECSESMMSGQMIAYAPSADNPGATSFETDRMSFGFGFRNSARKGDLLFYPIMTKAKVRLSAACMVAGSDTSVTIESFKTFVQNGFNPGINQGQVFAQVPNHVPLSFSGDRSGGVATPTMNIRGLSKRFGILGGSAKDDDNGATWKTDLEALAALDITKASNPANPNSPGSDNYFTRFLEGAKLLGDISLGDIIKLDFGGGRNIPKFQSLPEYNTDDELVAIKHRFEWNPTVDTFDAFESGTGTTFRLTNEIRQTFDGSEPSSLTSGILTNFSIIPLRGTTLEFVKIGFGSFSFTSRNGEKPDFDIQGLTYEFRGFLSFFNNLAKVLEAYQDNFSDPPSMNITSEGIELGYTLALPDLACGAFVMKNIAFSAGMTLPFNGPLALDLAFASRGNPFTLAVSLLGGGGFIGLNVGTKKLNHIEASLEAGAVAEINFGVAKGSVHAMVGIHFMIKNNPDGNSVDLAAYFRCGGSVRVLHLITASIEIYMELKYETASGKLSGYGEISVEVEVAFFSKTVTIGMHKTFVTASLEQEGPMYAGLPFIDDDDQFPDNSFWSAYGSAFADATGGLA